MELNKHRYGKHQQDCFYEITGIAPTICPSTHGAGSHLLKILVSPKLINTQFPSTKNTSQIIRSTAMYQISNGQMYQILKCFVVGSLANHSPSPERDSALTTFEVHCSLKSLKLHRKNSHAFYSLKMLKGFYLTTKAVPTELSSIRWMNLGMTSNGKCLTLKTSVSPRIGKECSLSDILEEQVDPKYFLSNKMVKYIMRNVVDHYPHLLPLITKAQASKEQAL